MEISKKKIYYKIVENHPEKGIRTLFHGIKGNRQLPVNLWLTAEIKEGVMDGHGTPYTSGIHVIDGLENAKEYLTRFRRNDRIIVKCHAIGLKPKKHSKSYVLLANKVKILNG